MGHGDPGGPTVPTLSDWSALVSDSGRLGPATPAQGAQLVAQLVAQDLSVGSLRQLGDELDPPRVLVRRDLLLDVLPQRALELFARLVPDVRHHERERLDQAVLVVGADD